MDHLVAPAERVGAVSLARFAKKRDANEADIIAALRAAGALVYALDRPVDLVVGYRRLWWLLEVKRPQGAVGEGQAEFMRLAASQGLPAYVVRTPQDALRAIGAAQ